ncbi:MAG: hypothetical protein JWP29_3446 [Rhodoferax sp.]|nr:hypothetical protein [Rhodoferax sp.]
MNHWIVRVATAFLMFSIVGLLVWTTEWVDEEHATPAQGEAATNRFYATQALLRELGAHVEKRSGLEAMPPKDAHLVLTSSQWNLFPGREQMLLDWVEGGGQLIIPPGMVGHASVEDWMPIAGELAPRQAHAPSGIAQKLLKDWNCRSVTEHRNTPVAQPGGAGVSYEVCGIRSHRVYGPAADQSPPTWSMQGPNGMEALRMQVGLGSVTVVGAWGLLGNSDLFLEGSARLVSAALQARPGAAYWFVVEEAREPLLSWLWDEAWPACGLTLLAVALALWRAVPRFGAMALPARVDRRSMAEQVRGTGRFLHWHGASALHAAQVRALNEAAQHALRGFAQAGGPRRTSLVAEATGLDVAALARALIDRTRVPAVMAHDLELLETARRRLLVRVATHRQNPPAST